MSTNAERLALHKGRMKKAGFRRLSVWVSAEMGAKLNAERKQGECTGRTLERLLLGQAAKRPRFPHGPTEGEKADLSNRIADAREGGNTARIAPVRA